MRYEGAYLAFIALRLILLISRFADDDAKY